MTELTKKLEKKSFEPSNNYSGVGDSDKKSNDNKDSDDEHIPKKDSILGSMYANTIQTIIVNAVKAQLGEWVRKPNLYTKPYTNRIDVLCVPHGYHPAKY